MEQLAKHGITMPPNMQGLTDEQIVELKLKDEWEEKCEPSGGHVFCKDDIGRRNGRGGSFVTTTLFIQLCFSLFIAPNANMQEVLNKTIKEAKDMISKV
jgi:DNA-directed RNA polymerase subunit E'/Rpb7